MTMQDANDEDLEWHSWPPRPVGGQQVGGHRAGVLVIHKPTGIAAVAVDGQRSQLRNRDQARAVLQAHLDAHVLCGELLESLRLASTTSDGYRDAHATYRRWAARLAPDAIGDEAKRAAIEASAAPRAAEARPMNEHLYALQVLHERTEREVAKLISDGYLYHSEDRQLEVDALATAIELLTARVKQEGATT
jgi:hypothetical protein